MKHLVIIINAPSNALHQRREFIKHFTDKTQVSLICPNVQALENEDSLKGINLIDLPFSRSGTSIFDELKVIFKLRKALSILNSPGVVFHSFTIKPILYTNLINKIFFGSKLNCFSTFTGLGYLFSKDSKKLLLQRFVSKMLRFCLYNKSSKVIFQNDDDKSNFISKGIVKDSSHVVLGSGVDTEYFSVSDKPIEPPLKFLYIGRLLKDKGVVELVNAFSKISSNHKAELKIAGDYDFDNPQSIDEQSWNSIKAQSNIQHLGFIEDIRSEINKADIVVLPSYREGLPLSLIQACSMGKAILTTQSPGCSQIVDQGVNGLKVQPASPTALHEAIIAFVNMPVKSLEKMGTKSRQKAEQQFSATVVNSKIEEIYSSS